MRWDKARAQLAIDFFPECLRLAEGAQRASRSAAAVAAFIVGSLFGWIGPDGFRRYRMAYLEIGKGNGKTPIAAGLVCSC